MKELKDYPIDALIKEILKRINEVKQETNQIIYKDMDCVVCFKRGFNRELIKRNRIWVCPYCETTYNYKDGKLIELKQNEYNEHFEYWFETIFWKLYPARNGHKAGKGITKKYLSIQKIQDLGKIEKALRNYVASKSIKDEIGICDPIRFVKKIYKEWINPTIYKKEKQSVEDATKQYKQNMRKNMS